MQRQHGGLPCPEPLTPCVDSLTEKGERMSEIADRPKGGPEQALEEIRPLLDRFLRVPADDPAVVTVAILQRMDRWFELFGMPKSATESYSGGGWRPSLGPWTSVGELVGHLYDNMGGGVPIELLQTMVVLAHDEWTGTPGY